MGGSLERSVVRQEELRNGFGFKTGKNMRRAGWKPTERVNLFSRTHAQTVIISLIKIVAVRVFWAVTLFSLN